MPKAYWIGRIDVNDPDAYKQYVAANAKAFGKYGARFLVRGGKAETREGSSRARNVVIEFKDYETARACYDSPEYREAMKLRENASAGDLIIVEGYDGPQPGA
ncbi:MAG: DUF1330 domain-containing protein [Methylobacteriaceae bacterium]|nr:DUF1330 domain-containing protein [Methylobacteriaceae bacterium]MBV9394670.1 DUF1330 domain-containing protein [Methylobacteriaceae bacterium]